MIGDFLYGLTDKDALGAPVQERFGSNKETSNAAVTVIVSHPVVPLDKVLLIDYVTFSADPGGAQTVSQFELRHDVDDSLDDSVAWLVKRFALSSASERFEQAFNGAPVLMPGERLVGIVTFSAGVAANVAHLSVLGRLIPRGNLQFR